MKKKGQQVLQDAKVRHENFDKIQQILIYIKKDIQKQISNMELLRLSRNNKLMLLFLINNQIITLDEEIVIIKTIFIFFKLLKIRIFKIINACI